MNTWTIEPIMNIYALLAVVAALVALMMIRPVFQSLTPRRMTVLSSTRLGVLLLLMVAMLRPGCVRMEEREQNAVVMLMFDLSRSMQLPHETTDVSRWQKLNETIQKNQPLLDRLAKKLELKAYGFDGQLHELKIDGGQIELPAEPLGGETDMATSIQSCLVRQRSQRIAATILWGDGVQNADDPLIELQQAVRELDQLQLPLYAIPFGQQANAGQMADVAVENMPDQFSVFIKNELAVSATVRIRGYVNREIPVNLIVEDKLGRQTIVDTVRVNVDQSNQQKQVVLRYSPQQAGQFKIVVKAEEQPQERVTLNNELPAFLTVYDGGLRVLYVRGDSRFEQKFLRRSIGQSPDIELDSIWLDQRNRDRWPIDISKKIEDGNYDVIILGDLDSRAIYKAGVQEESVEAILQLVESGKGLMLLGGYHSYGPGRYHSTPLADAFPIKMQKYEAQDFNTSINHDLHIDRPLKFRQPEHHFITNLSSGDGNRHVWQQLPPLDGANRFMGIKDRSRVLLESLQGDPLLVSGSYGGRVLAFAGDSTWRWWMQGQQETHKRFWRQAILWLAKRDGLENENVWIDLPQRRFDPGTPVELTFGAGSPTGQALQDVTYKAILVQPSGDRVSIATTNFGDENSAKVAKDLVQVPGTYTVEVSASQPSGLVGTAMADFIVFDRDKEKATPAADPATLGRTSPQTHKRGGASGRRPTRPSGGLSPPPLPSRQHPTWSRRWGAW